MTEIASFYATISANVKPFQEGLAGVKNEMSGLGKAAEAVGTTIKAGLMIGAGAITAIGAVVATTGISFDDLKEKSTIAFTTMLGSGEKAKSFLDDLQKFAATTPFEFPDVITASQRLMAMGFAADKVIPTMTAVGDAVAALGGDKGMIDRVVVALGQMNAKGKTQAGEMMQLTEAGIPAWQMLADAIGVSVPEAMDKVSKGAVDAQTTINAVTKGMESKFGGMMEKQSHTWSGLLSNIQDFFTQASGKVMKPFFDIAEKGLSKLVDFMSSDAFNRWVDRATAMVQSLADAFSDVFAMLAGGEDILSAVLTFIGDLVPDNLLPAWTNFATGFYNIVSNIVSWLQYLGTFFVSTFTVLTNGNLSWGQKLVAIWDMIYVTGQRIWTSLASSLSSLIPQWLDHLGEWGKAIWDWIVKNTPVALAKLGEWAAALWGYLADNLPTWISNLVDWATALWGWIVAVTPIALAKLQEWGTALLGYLAATLPGWIATFFDWGTALWEWIGSALPDAINALTNFVMSLRGEGGGATGKFWEMVGEWAKALWQWITDVALPQISPAFDRFMAAMKTAMIAIGSALGTLVSEFGKTLWYWIELAAPDTAKALQDWWGRITTWLSTTGVSWATTLAAWSVNLWKWVADAFGPLVNWLGQIAAQFITWKDVVTGAVIALGVIFWPTISAAFTAIMGAIGGFVAAWAPVIALFAGAILAVATLRNAWEGDWGGIRTNTVAALQFLAQAFQPLMDAIRQFGGDSLKEIIAWATGNQTNFTATQKIWEAAKTSFGTVFSAISAKLTEWGQLAVSWFQDHFPKASQQMNAAVDSIQGHWSLFVEAAHPLVVKIQDAWNKLVEDWKSGGGGISDAMHRLQNVLDNVWAIMISTIQYSINTVLNLMTLIVQLINGDWNGAWKTTQNIVHDAFEYIKNVAYHALDAIAGLFGSNADNVLHWVNEMLGHVRDAWNDFYNAGRDVIEGLWRGIQWAWNTFIAGPVVSLINSLPYSVRQALGIHSPSTVFADIGSDMMLGLAQGINGSQQFVVDAMGNIVQSVKTYSEWDKLGDALGQNQAKTFLANTKAVALNALSDIAKAGIGKDSNVYAWATQLAQSTSSDTLGNLKNNLNNVIQQFDALGLTNGVGADTRDTLSSLSGSLGDLISTGTYYAPYTPGTGGTVGGGGGGNADTLKFLQAIAQTLSKILAELQKDGKVAHQDADSMLQALAALSGGLNGKVNVTTGLRLA